MTEYMNDDIVRACVDLTDRAGASGFEIGYLHDGVPVEEAGWYAYAQYRGTRITVEDHRSPTGAALALAERLLQGAQCRCQQPVTLSDGVEGCRWRLLGARWEPGCDAPPVHIAGGRGDLGAMQRSMSEVGNRAARRAARRR